MNRTRLEKITRRLKPKLGELVVFHVDVDGNIYDAPFEEPGAQLVTPEELAQAQETGALVVLMCDVPGARFGAR